MAREPGRESSAGIWEQAQPNILANMCPTRLNKRRILLCPLCEGNCSWLRCRRRTQFVHVHSNSPSEGSER